MTITQITSPVEVNLSCIRGDMTEWDLVVVRNSINVDLTEGQVWMTARRNRGGPVVFQKNSNDEGGDGIVIDPDQVNNPGQCVIKLAVADTSALAAEVVTLFYDIQVKVGTDIWTVNYGSLVVSPDATTVTT